MSAAFDRAQQAHDANTEPPEYCGHEEWEAQDRIILTSETEDVNIVCTECRERGSVDFHGDDLSVTWDDE